MYVAEDQCWHSDLWEEIEKRGYPNPYMGISGRFDKDGPRYYGSPPEEFEKYYDPIRLKVQALLEHPKYPPGDSEDAFA